MHMAYEHTSVFYNTLVARIQSMEGFDKDTKIALLGRYKGELQFQINKEFKDVDKITGILDSKKLINSHPTRFISYYMGMKFNYSSSEEIEELKLNEEVKNMNVYPYFDSVKKIGNTIVVKLSNEY